MLATIRSFLVSTILVYLLDKTIDYLEGYSQEKEKEIEDYVRKLIPGEAFDDVAWAFVQSVMPKIFDAARILLGRWKDADSGERRGLLAQGVCSVLKGDVA